MRRALSIGVPEERVDDDAPEAELAVRYLRRDSSARMMRCCYLFQRFLLLTSLGAP